jgi:hypothetical protein
MVQKKRKKKQKQRLLLEIILHNMVLSTQQAYLILKPNNTLYYTPAPVAPVHPAMAVVATMPTTTP